MSLVSFTIPLLQFDITQHKVAITVKKQSTELHPRMRICFEAESDTPDANLAFAGLPGRTAASDHRSPRNIRLKLRLRFQVFKGGSDGYGRKRDS